MKKYLLIYAMILIFMGACHQKEEEWFHITKLDSKTYRISEAQSSQGNISYLIVGDKEAILFDSGSGENKSESIKTLVDSLAGVPVSLLHSHFHFDHIGNSSDFSCIALPELPDLLSQLDSNKVIHLSEKETLITNNRPFKIAKTFPLNEEIDLGDRKIQILHTPGHSPWSFTIIDKENKFLFAGDLIYKGLLLVNHLDDYQNSLYKLINTYDSTFQILSAHGKDDLIYSDLDKVRLALESFQSKRPKSEKEINFFGLKKRMYVVDGIPFIYDESGNY